MQPVTERHHMDWNTLEEACRSCNRCELGRTRTNCVFGTGSKTAELMFIGEAPGEQEDKMGTPFVGRAGQLLDKYFEAVGIERSEVYIANILKCRPPQNRDPLPAEQDTCIEYLRGQVSLIRPKLIVCLGRIAAMRIIRPDYRITLEHGQWIERSGVAMTAVYHPSLLLRDPRKREDMLIDMKEIKSRLDAVRASESGSH